MKTFTREERLELLASSKNQSKQDKANSYRGASVNNIKDAFKNINS